MDKQEKNHDKLNQELNELRQKYETVIKRLDVIEKENNHTVNSIKSIENSFVVMNNNMSELMKKLDTMIDDREAMKMFKMDNVRQKGSSLMGMVTKPMRKLAIGTMKTMFTMADYASEKVSSAREGLEDMVAEAQYKSKKNKSNMMTVNISEQ